MQTSPLLSLSPSSPSFNSYSSANLADIAARVVEEFRKDSEFDSSIYDWETERLFSQEREEQENKDDVVCSNVNNQDNHQEVEVEDEDGDDDDDEFEFAVVCRRPDSPISADEIFYNGQIKPIYPLFNTALLLNDNHINHSSSSSTTSSSKTSTRSPLRKLMSEDRETTTSCSSSEADDLESLQPGTYCVWTPKASKSQQDSPGRCKKSNSTGSSKRWKFRDFLYRSNSDGKDTFVFLNPSNKKSHDHHQKVAEESKEKGKVKVVEEHSVKNHQAIKEEDKRKSFLPYRQDLVGIFNNVNGLSRNFHPF